MAIGTNWAEVWDPVWGPVWQGSAALVEVPDVIGETQAAGTATLEGVAFVVAVETAYSSTVAAGLIIEQSPAAGIEAAEGSTVTITVSLGPQQGRTPAGGYDPYRKPSKVNQRRDKDRDELRALLDAQLAKKLLVTIDQAIERKEPVKQSAPKIIDASTDALALIAEDKLRTYLAVARLSKDAKQILARLEQAIEAAIRRQRILKDDEELLKLLGASGLLQ